MSSIIYVLRCADDCYYIGSTNNFDQRMQQHRGEIPDCTKFTQLHKFIDVEKVMEVPKKFRLQIEHEITLSYVHKYGIDRVAGGFLVNRVQREKYKRDHN